MKFGLYLKKKGVITAEQLAAALEYQLDHVVPIGQLAIEEGVLTARQVFTVLHCQSGSPHERFGEIAVGMRMMTHTQLDRLLMLQWERMPSIEEALVRLQILSHACVSKELAAFRASMEQHNVVVKRCIQAAPHLVTKSETSPLAEAAEEAERFTFSR